MLIVGSVGSIDTIFTVVVILFVGHCRRISGIIQKSTKPSLVFICSLLTTIVVGVVDGVVIIDAVVVIFLVVVGTVAIIT